MTDLYPPGTPARSPSNGSLRRRARHPYPQDPLMASQSMQDLPSTTFGTAQGDNWMPAPSRRNSSTASFNPGPQRLPGQHAHPLATRSVQDLSSTAFKPAFTGPQVRPTSIDSLLFKKVQRMRYFLIWNLTFTYGVDMELLRSYLTDDLSKLTPNTADYSHFFELGELLGLAQERVRKNQLSLVTGYDYRRISDEIVAPALCLGILPEYLCEQLMWFPAHQFSPGKQHKTALFSRSTKALFSSARKWGDKKTQTDLAQRLVSDDCVVSQLAPTEQLQVVLGTLIAAFSNRHCKPGMGSVQRRIYAQPHMSALLFEVENCRRTVPRPVSQPVPQPAEAPLLRRRPVSTIYSEDEEEKEEEKAEVGSAR